MRRHVLIGRFGPGDNERLPIADDEVETRLDFVAGEKRLDHGIGRALDDLAKLGVYPTEVGLDLLVLAAHVHAARHARLAGASESQDELDPRASLSCSRQRSGTVGGCRACSRPAPELSHRRPLGDLLPASATPFCGDRPQKATAADRCAVRRPRAIFWRTSTA